MHKGAHPGLSGADQLRLSDRPFDRVLAIEPALSEPMRRFLAIQAPVENLNDVKIVASTDPEGFQAMATVLANAYFMCETVCEEIGYPGQEARDSFIGLTEIDIALIDRVNSVVVTWRRGTPDN